MLPSVISLNRGTCLQVEPGTNLNGTGGSGALLRPVSTQFQTRTTSAEMKRSGDGEPKPKLLAEMLYHSDPWTPVSAPFS